VKWHSLFTYFASKGINNPNLHHSKIKTMRYKCCSENNNHECHFLCEAPKKWTESSDNLEERRDSVPDREFPQGRQNVGTEKQLSPRYADIVAS
jgi:hypothetical protein